MKAATDLFARKRTLLMSAMGGKRTLVKERVGGRIHRSAERLSYVANRPIRRDDCFSNWNSANLLGPPKTQPNAVITIEKITTES